MDELLRGLRQEGQLESVGRFTFDFSRGFDKLRRFQSHPDQFAVMLLAAAVQRGARELEMRCAPREFGLTFEAPGYAWEELQSLFQLQQPDLALFRLNLGLLCCLGLDPEVIRLETWGQRLGYRLTVRGNQLEVIGLSGRSKPDRTTLWMALERSCGQPTPEAVTLLRRCAFCAGLTLNGRPLIRPVPLATRGESPRRLWPELPNRPGSPEAAFFGEPSSTVACILNGVAFPLEGWPLGDFLGAVAWTPQLGTDLSFAKPRQDEAAEQVIPALLEALDDLLPTILEQCELSQAQQSRALEYLAQRPAPLLQRGQMALVRWSVERDLAEGVVRLIASRPEGSDPELEALWQRSFERLLERLHEARGARLLTEPELRELARLWSELEPLYPPARQQRQRLSLLSWDLEEAAAFNPLAAWAVGYTESAREELGPEHPLCCLARGELERAEAGFAGLPGWRARCRRLRGEEPGELPGAAQTFQLEWVLAEQLRRPEAPASLRALAPMLKFLRDSQDLRLLTSLAERERERRGQAVAAAPSLLPARDLCEALRTGFSWERNGQRERAEGRYLGLLYGSRVMQPAHPVTRLLAVWLGHFYLEHGLFEEGIRHLLWGELGDFLPEQRADSTPGA